MAFLLLNIESLLHINWENVSVLKSGALQFHITTYFVFSLIFAAGVSLVSAWLYYRFRYDRIKQLTHRYK